MEASSRSQSTHRATRRRARQGRGIAGRDPSWTGGPTSLHLADDELERARQRCAQRGIEELSEAQELLWASDSYSLLVVLQAMDAAGKDSAIEHVMSGVNPQGVQVVSFRKPSAEELDHDFLWRITRCASRAGPHRHLQPVALRGGGRAQGPSRVARRRSGFRRASATNASGRSATRTSTRFERHLDRNGTKIVKFFLHVSKAEQKQRFLAGSTRPARSGSSTPPTSTSGARWDDYMSAFEDALTATSTPWAPWYVIPADHKPLTQALVALALVDTIRSLDLRWPEVSEAEHAANLEARKKLETEP